MCFGSRLKTHCNHMKVVVVLIELQRKLGVEEYYSCSISSPSVNFSGKEEMKRTDGRRRAGGQGLVLF